MNSYEHLPLSPYQGEVQRQTRGGGAGYKMLDGRNKNNYTQQTIQKTDNVLNNFNSSKIKYSGIINPSLIFEIEINQTVDFKAIEQILFSMGIHILSSAGNNKGYWVVFSDDENLLSFKEKLNEHGKPLGQFIPENAFRNSRISSDISIEIREHLKRNGILNPDYKLVKEKAKIFGSIQKIFLPIPDNMLIFKKEIIEVLKRYHPGNYDFFNAFGELRDITREEKIGDKLRNQPLTDEPSFLDIELWRMTDIQKNISFIDELKAVYHDQSTFRITDQIITKSFVLMRVRLSRNVFNEIIEFKEISRADRPALPSFNSFDIKNVDITELAMEAPNDAAAGILIIDSGILSNHPMLERCVGDEQNFQSGETSAHDSVGHGTAVAGCAAYGDIEQCILEKRFSPANWIFSAKVMYAETNPLNGEIRAVYDPEKLVEHQLKDAVDSFLSNPEYHIRIVNISLGNLNEVWHKSYRRQLPLAAMIDELAYTYPFVVFIVSTGNQSPLDILNYNSIDDIKSSYPEYLVKHPDFKIINPATSALALTIGSIAQPLRAQAVRYGEEQIKIPIAEENQPSPFTRTGPGINGMIKPELVEYGGNIIMYNNHNIISEDIGGKLALLNNNTTSSLLRFDYGTSFSAPKVVHIAGQIVNRFPQRSANFIKNMLLCSAYYPFKPDDNFYASKNGKASEDHLNVCGFGLPNFERAINSFDNRVLLFEESKLQLNKVKVYQIPIPESIFNDKGRKRITVTLSFTPETRLTRGDSYLGNRMKYYLFHSLNPQVLVDSFGVVDSAEDEVIPDFVKKYKLDLSPGISIRDKGCHQKAWLNIKTKHISSPVSLVLINYNKWMYDESIQTDYCISVVFEHENEIDLYNQIRSNVQTRTRVR